MAGTEWSFHAIVLPIGLSFFSFQQIAYLVDAFRGQAREYHLVDYIRDHFAAVAEAGANVLVAGSAVFGGGDYASAIAALRGAATEGHRRSSSGDAA